MVIPLNSEFRATGGYAFVGSHCTMHICDFGCFFRVRYRIGVGRIWQLMERRREGAGPDIVVGSVGWRGH